MVKKPQNKPKIETEPDAWKRFENAVHKIAPPKKPKAAANEKKR
jgi:hypothetical protein